MKEKYLKLLAKNFGNKEAVITEIINLEAILSLPKGTEHFVSDIHGEYDAFQHVLRNGSGNVKRKLIDLFEYRMTLGERARLSSLVYYPEEKVAEYKKEFETEEELYHWYAKTLNLLIETTIYCSSKYTRSKVRKAFPSSFSYIMEELLYNVDASTDKMDYSSEVLDKVISLGRADDLIIAFCYAIQRFVVDHLHVVGDIYDRGPAPHKIMELLIDHHSVDIQWGNHDILWMGAVCGSKACMANLIRICARYDNMSILEDVYGINLRPLLTFAETNYQNNSEFFPKLDYAADSETDEERVQIAQIHQAIAIIQFKLEGEIIQRRPEFDMDHRLMLDKMNDDFTKITIDGKEYPLENGCFPTIDPKNPYKLSEEEEHIVDKLMLGFQSSEKLIRHIDFLFRKGSLYLLYNGNLLIHGCVPLTKDGSFQELKIRGKKYKGKELLDELDRQVRKSYASQHVFNDLSTDLIWYLWCGYCSPLFGKTAMTTFERYFIKDKETHKEHGNYYYKLREKIAVCESILVDFGLSTKDGRIINGHTPVQEIKGENPMKADGKVIVIDGGFSRPYQSTTGIGGYSLLYNSYGMELIAHEPFVSREDAIKSGQDIVSTTRILDEEKERQKIRGTNIGQILMRDSGDLQLLLKWIEKGKIQM